MEVTDEHPTVPRRLKAFSIAEQSARKVLRRRLRVLYLAKDAYQKLAGEGDALGHARTDLTLMLRLARAWARREYQAVPWKSLLYAVAAIIYFVNPVDLIPDALAGIGFIDDVAVITTVVGAIRKDLDAFRYWEQRRLAPEVEDLGEV
ncbi:MAG TPA: YkvA family protein [Rhodothermales bacterium]|nr:YkvA family protein [Rhodothermales bacterium]